MGKVKMFSVPVTYAFDFKRTNDTMRPYVMHEFAVNGVKHLVLNETLFQMILENREMAGILNREMAGEGLTFCDAHAVFGPYLDLCCPVPDARPEMLLRLKLQLQIIAGMGVKTITIHIGNETHYPGYTLQSMIDSVKSSLNELLPLAESLGVIICIENIWFQMNTPERLLDFKAEFPTDALGFCYDAGHANLMDKGRNFPGSKPYTAWGSVPPHFDHQILEKMLPHVVNCHLHDNDGIMDQHVNVGLGTMDWKHVVDLLRQAPRLQVIQSEVLPVKTIVSIPEICKKFHWLSEL